MDARLELLPRGGGAGGRSDPGRLPPKDGPKARARRKRVASATPLGLPGPTPTDSLGLFDGCTSSSPEGLRTAPAAVRRPARLGSNRTHTDTARRKGEEASQSAVSRACLARGSQPSVSLVLPVWMTSAAAEMRG